MKNRKIDNSKRCKKKNKKMSKMRIKSKLSNSRHTVLLVKKVVRMIRVISDDSFTNNIILFFSINGYFTLLVFKY